MSNVSKTLLTLLAAGAMTAAASARDLGQDVTFLATAPGDLAAPVAVAAPATAKAIATGDVPREPVALSWALPADKALETPEPFVARSREYFVDLDASELRAGVPVYTHAPGALVRLSPAAGETAGPIDPHKVVLESADKRRFAGGDGMELIASAEQLRAAGSPFAVGTAAFRLEPRVGSGTLALRVPELPGEGRYVMHVLDVRSPVHLALQTDQASYLHGQELHVEASFEAGELLSAEGFITSPSGRAWPLEWETGDDGRARARLVLDGLETPAPGLWEVHASARGLADGTSVLRHTRVAFDCGIPAARLDGTAEIVGRGADLTLALGIESASASRYEVRGVLMGTDTSGTLVPVAVAHSADWLEAGVGSLSLSFDADLLEAAGVEGPFEVHDLQLLDQAAMKVLHRQGRGLLIR